MNLRNVSIFIIRLAIGAVVVLLALGMLGIKFEAMAWYKVLAGFLVLSIGYEILPPIRPVGWPRKTNDDSAG